MTLASSSPPPCPTPRTDALARWSVRAPAGARATTLALALAVALGTPGRAQGPTLSLHLDPPEPDLEGQPLLAADVPALRIDARGSDGTLVVAKGAAPPADPGVEWKGSLSVGAVVAAGNTRRRTANAGLELERRHLSHRSTLKFAGNYAQAKANGATTYDLDQRDLHGIIKQDYFVAKKSFVFLAASAAHDYARELDLRVTATSGYGFQILDSKTTSFSAEVGAGYYVEQSRVTGTRDKEYTAGRLTADFATRLNDTWQLLNTTTYVLSLENADEFEGSVDSRLRGTLTRRLYAQLQWIVDFDNTPLIDVSGRRNDRLDHQVFLQIGWTF
jgi:putative salt-induced outer membrane protein YdiY